MKLLVFSIIVGIFVLCGGGGVFVSPVVCQTTGCQPCANCNETCVPCVPDLPCNETENNLVEFPSCSLLIPMDHLAYGLDPERRGNVNPLWDPPNLRFNFRTYGLLVRLLHADIPLRWIIRDGKQKATDFNEIDVVKNVSMVYPNASSVTFMRNFTSGLFLIEVEYRAAAEPIIEAYNAETAATEGSALQVVVYELNENQETDPGALPSGPDVAPGFFFPLAHNVNRKPFVAVFDSSMSGKYEIQLQFLNNSGWVRNETWDFDGDTIPWANRTQPRPSNIHYTLLSKDDAATFQDDICLTFATEPHFHSGPDPNVAIPFIQVARQFVEAGGNVLFECGGIQTYENCDVEVPTAGVPPCTNESLGFFSTGGFSKIPPGGGDLDGTTPYTWYHGSLPAMQMDDNWDFQDGSVHLMKLVTSSMCAGCQDSELRDSLSEKAVFALSETSTGGSEELYIVSSGKLRRDQEQGYNFFMLAGHHYNDPNPIGDLTYRTGARVYMNAALIPSNRPAICGFDIPDPDPPQDGKKRRNHPRRALAKRANPEAIPCGCNLFYDACGVCGGPNTGSCGQGIGACCLDQLCDWPSTQSECLGNYQGDDTDCFTTPSICTSAPDTSGACCDPVAESCSVTSYSLCVDGGGEFLGDGTSCSPGSPCASSNLGACCRAAGTCEDMVYPQQCPFPDIHLGTGSVCGGASTCPTGACCDASAGSCSITTPNTCSAGVYQGDGTECATTNCTTEATSGACCPSPTLTVCSLVADESLCSGVYHGDSSTCSPTNPCDPTTSTDTDTGGDGGGDDTLPTGTIAGIAAAAGVVCCCLLLLLLLITLIGTVVWFGVRKKAQRAAIRGSGSSSSNWANAFHDEI